MGALVLQSPMSGCLPSRPTRVPYFIIWRIPSSCAHVANGFGVRCARNGIVVEQPSLLRKCRIARDNGRLSAHGPSAEDRVSTEYTEFRAINYGGAGSRQLRTNMDCSKPAWLPLLRPIRRDLATGRKLAMIEWHGRCSRFGNDDGPRITIRLHDRWLPVRPALAPSLAADAGTRDYITDRDRLAANDWAAPSNSSFDRSTGRVYS